MSGIEGWLPMTWVKLDDQFFRNPKSLAAGKDGRALYLAGVCYCASALTDGWIAFEALSPIAADAGVKVSVARVLERVGLWEESVGGFWVHDYLKYNPTAASVRDKREKRAAAGSKGGSTTAAKRAAFAASDAASVGSASDAPPFPSPVPSPKTTGQELGADIVDFRLERGLG